LSFTLGAQASRRQLFLLSEVRRLSARSQKRPARTPALPGG